ncbi:hypothetical protein POV27_10735 [Aureisphaera galaxeae]|uniref:hypothetical protein n=1 Tax=Aureisphaera galaxeae TaxID=1538023 RepID=UPI00234FF77E|nr:hypothetical protein [Aureisphaera galaxeae]MDC8004524.1 hypothetical protein [Aureisphaera galaxeae]
MTEKTPRRAFLRMSAMATTGIALLPSATINAFNEPSSPFEGYNAYAEEKTDLRTLPFGKHVRVSGTIFNHLGTTPLANAQVEVWHMSPNSTKFRHRGKCKTDATGAYSFITDLPNNEKGRSGRIYFKVSKDGNTYFTELVVTPYFAHITSKHWKENKQLEDRVFLKRDTHFGETRINFNIALNQ